MNDGLNWVCHTIVDAGNLGHARNCNYDQLDHLRKGMLPGHGPPAIWCSLTVLTESILNKLRPSSDEHLADLDRYLDIHVMGTWHVTVIKLKSIYIGARKQSFTPVTWPNRHLLYEEQLKEILDQSKTKHEVSGNAEWHHQYLKVKPLRLNNDELIYKIIIPLVAPRPYF